MPTELPPAKVAELLDQGHVLVDTRAPSAFSSAHPKGALNLVYSQRGLADRLKPFVAPGTRVVLLASNAMETGGAVRQLEAGGFSVVGAIAGGLPGWLAADLPVAATPQVHADQLAPGKLAKDTVVLDVREPIEWELGHVPGATLISLSDVRERMRELPRDRKLAVICEAGVRSSAIASMLAANGFTNVANVPEGTGGYRNLGFPLEYYEERAEG